MNYVCNVDAIDGSRLMLQAGKNGKLGNNGNLHNLYGKPGFNVGNQN